MHTTLHRSIQSHRSNRCSIGCGFVVCLTIVLNGCGGGSTDSVATSNVSIGFSDAAVDDADKVVITVDAITFQRGEGEDAENDIVVDTFASDDTADTSNDTFRIDLLQFQGDDKALVIDSVSLPVGTYSNMLIDVLDEDSSMSYVQVDDVQKALKVPSGTLKLGGFTVATTATMSFVVEFGLQQSMTYNPGPDRYILKPRGVRIVDEQQAALISGVIDHSTLQGLSNNCVATGAGDPGGTAGNIYLYPGEHTADSLLGDNFDPDIAANDSAYVPPIASSTLDAAQFTLSYLEPGNYTLAVSCHDQDDSADDLQMLIIPNPATQITTVQIEAGQALTCNIPLDGSGCNTTEESE